MFGFSMGAVSKINPLVFMSAFIQTLITVLSRSNRSSTHLTVKKAVIFFYDLEAVFPQVPLDFIDCNVKNGRHCINVSSRVFKEIGTDSFVILLILFITGAA